MNDRPIIDAIAEAVADGNPVDWPAAARLLDEGRQRRLLDSFREVGARSAAETGSPSATSRPVGTIVRLLVVLALAHLALATAGFLAGARDAIDVPPAWQFLVMAVFAGGGLGLVSNGSRDSRAVLLGAFYLLAATAFDERFFGSLVGSPRPVWASVRLEAFLPYVLWRFVQEFPAATRLSAVDRMAAGAAGASLVLGCALTAASLALAAAPVGAAVLAPLGRGSNYGLIYWAIVSVPTLAALAVAPLRARSAPAAERRRVAVFLGAIGLGASPVLLEVCLEVLYPPFSRIVVGSAIAWLAALTYPFLASIPLTTAYAVLVDGVLDVRRVARRAAEYALARWTLLFLTGVPLVLLVRLGLRYRDVTLGDLLSQGGGRWLLGTSLLGVVMLLLRERIARAVDRAFGRGELAVDALVALAAAEAREVGDRRELAERIEPTLARALGTTGVRLLVSDEAGGFLAARDGPTRLPATAALVAMLGDEDAALDVSREGRESLWTLLPPEERRWLAEGPWVALAPIRGLAGRLVGVLLTGPRRDGLGLEHADLAALGAAAGPVALAAGRVLAAGGNGGPPGADEPPAAECDSCGRVMDRSTERCVCGEAPRLAPVPLVVAGKVRLERRLGRGGMGLAYLAHDETLGRRVAVKALPHRVADAVRRMDREARAMAAVAHPRVATIFGLETWRGAPLLILEFVPGGTLQDRLRGGPMAPAEAVELGLALTDGLQAIHAQGLLHRDIKPSNIAFGADGLPKLLDFGLAGLVGLDSQESPGAGSGTGEAFTTLQAVAGTPLYVAPETLLGEPPTPAVDVWSLSVVLYEAIGGRSPFAGDTLTEVLERVARADPPPLRAIRPDCPPALADLLGELLAKDPAKRPPGALALRQRLAEVAPRL